jgi:cell division FtsZ-interacting protein ZapD
MAIARDDEVYVALDGDFQKRVVIRVIFDLLDVFGRLEDGCFGADEV